MPANAQSALPPGSVLFYIGPPKTGTTGLQRAASAKRDTLYELGTYYPGASWNHRPELYSAIGRVPPMKRGGQGRGSHSSSSGGDRGKWRRLIADINSEPTKRVLISHESAAGIGKATANKLVTELGVDRTHIVLTLRSPATQLASMWAEFLKDGLVEEFDPWLERSLGIAGKPLPLAVRRGTNLGGLVKRWVSIVGSDHVSVILIDQRRPDFLAECFEGLLGLPAQTLSGPSASGDVTNRSLSRPEAEWLRSVNILTRPKSTTPWPLYLKVVRHGAVHQLLAERNPTLSEPRIRVPRWSVEPLVKLGTEYARQIADSGVHVYGDLSRLYERPKVAEDEPATDPVVFEDLAVEALIGAMASAARIETNMSNKIDALRKQLEGL